MENKTDKKFDQPSPILVIANHYLWVLLLSLMVALLTLGYFFVLGPKITSIQQSQDDNTLVVDKQKEVDDLIKKVTDLNTSYKAIQNQRSRDLRKLQQILPAEPQIAELFVIAERLANQRGFILSSLDISDSTEALNSQENSTYPEGVKLLMLNMKVSKEIDLENPPAVDSYTAFKQYLDDLERNLRLFDIQTVSFSGVGDPSATALSFSFTVLTYYSSEEDTSAAKETVDPKKEEIIEELSN